MTDYNPFDNPDFRKELAEMLDMKLEPVLELRKKVDEHDAAINRSRGAMWVLSGLWALLLSLLSGHIWFGHTK
jgi:hypothetical protein